MIPLTINTHIDCSKNSKSVFGAFSKQQQGTLKVCCSAFFVSLTVSGNFQLSPLLLSVFLALDFNQDQEPEKKRPLGTQNIDSVSQSDC